MTIYGWIMLDLGYDVRRIDPAYFDTMRVSKLPSYPKQFGMDGRTFAGVRQTRLGVRTSTPTPLGDFKTQFEFDLFGTGADAGQTTFHMRHAYGELGALGAGHTYSPFMDPNLFPNDLDFWGPTGILNLRNVQVRWMPIRGASHLTLALERPGGSADEGVYADRIELSNVTARFTLPDLSGEYTHGTSWGYVKGAGIVRRLAWDDTRADRYDLSGSAIGWGFSVSMNARVGARELLRMQSVYGKGIENHMYDAPTDVGAATNPGNDVSPIVGRLIPVLGTTLFLEHSWNPRWSTTVGYSRTDIDNTSGQAPSAYRGGQYALANLLYRPVPDLLVGGEMEWGRRANFGDGFSSTGLMIHFSFKYSFSGTVRGTR